MIRGHGRIKDGETERLEALCLQGHEAEARASHGQARAGLPAWRSETVLGWSDLGVSSVLDVRPLCPAV